MTQRPLLTPAANNPKTAKDGDRFEAAILHLAPSTLAGVGDICPWSTPGCRAACLNTAGRGQMNSVQAARIRRTRYFMERREAFFAQLVDEIGSLQTRAIKRGTTPVVRLNGTSDIPWERFRPFGGADRLMDVFGGVQFYDYTKSYKRAKLATLADWPTNYSLTLSRSEAWSAGMVGDIVRLGINVAVVFRDTIPAEYEGAPTIDGTLSDWRFEDPRGVVVGLLAKGRAKKDRTGFVVDAD